MAHDSYSDLLKTVIAGEALTREQTHEAFGEIMDGAWTKAQIAGLLVALSAKGETADEIAGAAAAMRERVVPVDTHGRDVIDIVGTGGTGLRTLNVSTPACMVAAGAGVPVAKHGNRTNTRASGSADVLEALGVNLDAPPPTLEKCLAEAGMCYCFAIKHHPAMKHAVPVRKQLAVRTIFNILGPLTNPAGAKRQVLGVFRAEMAERMAETLAKLGAVRAMVVHAEDGLDEISITSPTQVSELRDGQVTTRTVGPEDFGLARATMADLAVGSAAESAQIVREVLGGAKGPARDIIVLNAAAGIAVADRAADIAAALPLAAESIDSGAAAAVLGKLIATSNA